MSPGMYIIWSRIVVPIFFLPSQCTVKSSMWIYFYIFLVIWTRCYNTSAAGDDAVIWSSQVVLAKVGDDVILPCHIKPPVNATKMTVEWSRPDLKPEYVHVLQDGHVISHSENQLYKQRTSLFAEELPHGNISLKLFRMQLLDMGTFRCFVPHLHSSCWVQLIVGSQPVISFTGKKDNGLSSIYLCDSGCWYAEPEVSWLDGEGNLLPAEPSETVRLSHHCYVGRRSVAVSGAETVTCRVHQPHINYTVDEIYSVIPVVLPAVGTLGGPIAVGLWIAGIMSVILIMIVIMVLLKRTWKRQASDDVEMSCQDKLLPENRNEGSPASPKEEPQSQQNRQRLSKTKSLPLSNSTEKDYVLSKRSVSLRSRQHGEQTGSGQLLQEKKKGL